MSNGKFRVEKRVYIPESFFVILMRKSVNPRKWITEDKRGTTIASMSELKYSRIFHQKSVWFRKLKWFFNRTVTPVIKLLKQNLKLIVPFESTKRRISCVDNCMRIKHILGGYFFFFWTVPQKTEDGKGGIFLNVFCNIDEKIC